MLRYILLRHEMPPDSDRGSHWDFMLERDNVLWTWALEELPATWLKQLGLSHDAASDEVAALRLGDHRLSYLDYEGPLSGNRGSVVRRATGEFELVQNDGRQIEVKLMGDLTGCTRLTVADGKSDEWLLKV